MVPIVSLFDSGNSKNDYLILVRVKMIILIQVRVEMINSQTRTFWTQKKTIQMKIILKSGWHLSDVMFFGSGSVNQGTGMKFFLLENEGTAMRQ